MWRPTHSMNYQILIWKGLKNWSFLNLVSPLPVKLENIPFSYETYRVNLSIGVLAYSDHRTWNIKKWKIKKDYIQSVEHR